MADEEPEQTEQAVALPSGPTGSSNPDTSKVQEDKTKKEMEAIKKYLESMAYKVPEKVPKSTYETEMLAKPKPRNVADLINYQHVTFPIEKKKRIKILARDAIQPMSTEQLAEIFKEFRRKQELDERKKKVRDKLYLKTFKKLEAKCKLQVMNEIFDKFINIISDKCTKYKSPEIVTESMQKLAYSLKKYIFLALSPKTCLSQCDQTALDTLSMVLADLIFQTLYIMPKLRDENDDEYKRIQCEHKDFSEEICREVEYRSWTAAKRRTKC